MQSNMSLGGTNTSDSQKILGSQELLCEGIMYLDILFFPSTRNHSVHQLELEWWIMQKWGYAFESFEKGYMDDSGTLDSVSKLWTFKMNSPNTTSKFLGKNTIQSHLNGSHETCTSVSESVVLTDLYFLRRTLLGRIKPVEIQQGKS